MKKYSYSDRVELLETALENWVNTFTNPIDIHTAELIAFSGAYFDYGGPIAMYDGPFSPKNTQRKMIDEVARMARAYKVCALSMVSEDGNVPAKYWKEYPVPS